MVTYLPTYASGQLGARTMTMFLAVVLAAGLLSFHLISYSTLALVLAFEQLHVHG